MHQLALVKIFFQVVNVEILIIDPIVHAHMGAIARERHIPPSTVPVLTGVWRPFPNRILMELLLPALVWERGNTRRRTKQVVRNTQLTMSSLDKM